MQRAGGVADAARTALVHADAFVSPANSARVAKILATLDQLTREGGEAVRGGAHLGWRFRQSHRPVVDGTCAGDDAIAGQILFIHIEILSGMFNKKIVLIERIFIQQTHYPLPGSTFTQSFLFFDCLFTSAQKYFPSLFM